MKTSEEKANKRFPNVSFKKDVESEDTFSTNEIRLLQRLAYIEGYNEAMRWRDPKEELPKEGQMVQIKAFNDHNSMLYYDHDKYLGNNRWDRNTSIYITIIGWRPIE